MQSINEELQTINAEMAGKNEALTRLNSDLKNLLDSTEIATMFLDDELRIKSFTPAMTDIFRLRDSDRGRPVTDIATILNYSDLAEDAQRVQRRLSIVEREVEIRDGGMTFIMRIRPYRTVDNLIDGVVITFLDITARKRTELSVQEHAAIVEASQDALVRASVRGTIETWNPAAARLFGYTAQEIVGQPTLLLWSPLQAQEHTALLAQAAAGTASDNVETVGRRKDGSEFDAELSIVPIFAENGQVLSIVKTVRNITERRRARFQREILLNELNHRVKNTLATVQSIATQTLRNESTLEAFRENFGARLIALSKSHDLLTRKNWEGASLHGLLMQECEPYQADGAPRFEIVGDDLQVPPRMALALGMVFHELTTNAAKYGALSVPAGRIDVSWNLHERDGQTYLHLQWTETGGPRVEKPRRSGMGSRLMKHGLAHELGGEARIDFDPSGVQYMIDVPFVSPQGP
jgi:two-component system CheB/CheR fusion protein